MIDCIIIYLMCCCMITSSIACIGTIRWFGIGWCRRCRESPQILTATSAEHMQTALQPQRVLEHTMPPFSTKQYHYGQASNSHLSVVTLLLIIATHHHRPLDASLHLPATHPRAELSASFESMPIIWAGLCVCCHGIPVEEEEEGSHWRREVFLKDVWVFVYVMIKSVCVCGLQKHLSSICSKLVGFKTPNFLWTKSPPLQTKLRIFVNAQYWNLGISTSKDVM